ncbi:MAG: hypothetical protein ISP57_04720 [Flavobacteriaceae bacterium]|nr:hypothetical protein [Flavobacteriaceae bacterium]
MKKHDLGFFIIIGTILIDLFIKLNSYLIISLMLIGITLSAVGIYEIWKNKKNKEQKE